MAKTTKKVVLNDEHILLNELSQLIEQSEQMVAQANSTLTMLFWYIGKLINQTMLKNKRAD
jgi:hypothetical protein